MPFSPWWFATLLPIAAFGLRWRRRRPSLGALLDRAVARGSLDPVWAGLGRPKEDLPPTLLNQMIRRLWDRYERALAADAIRVLAERHGEMKIAQYWLDQLLKTEPTLVPRLGPRFMEMHYRPEVAAQCGPVG